MNSGRKEISFIRVTCEKVTAEIHFSESGGAGRREPELPDHHLSEKSDNLISAEAVEPRRTNVLNETLLSALKSLIIQKIKMQRKPTPSPRGSQNVWAAGSYIIPWISRTTHCV